MRSGRMVFFLQVLLSLLLLSQRAAYCDAQYLIDFDDLPGGYVFSEANQAYADLNPAEGHGIIIGGGGVPTVIRPPSLSGVYSAPNSLRNQPRYEFGSEFEDVEITFLGFTSHYARVYVGLDTRAWNAVTATMFAFQGGVLLDTDEVNLGVGTTFVNHMLVVESDTGAIDRVAISYRYTAPPAGSGYDGRPGEAGEAELMDSFLVRVWEEAPPLPPEDTTPPVVHILHPDDGETVSGGTVLGYVEEETGLTELRLTTPLGTYGLLPSVEMRIRDGAPAYFYTFDNEAALVSGSNPLTVRAVDAGGHEDSQTVTVTYDPPTYTPPPPVWPDTLDFIATGMEVTQVIQGWDMIGPTDALIDSEVPLVAKKKTLVRVYGQLSGIGTPVSEVGCRLRAFTDSSYSEQLPGSPLYVTHRVTVVPGETYLEQRPFHAKSFNFILPPEWTAPGTVYLRATVNPGGIPESNYDALNDTIRDVTFYDTDSFCVLVYPIRSTEEDNVSPTWAECLDNVSLLRKIYPVNPEKLTVYLAQRLRTDAVLDDDHGGTDDDLADLLTAFRRHLGLYYGQAYALPCTHAVFMGLTDDTVEHRGMTAYDRPVSLSVASNDFFFRLKTAHEAGHSQGLGHVQGCSDPAAPYEAYDTYRRPDGSRLPRESIGDWGVDIRDDNTLNILSPEDYGDLMSYCGSSRWMSIYTWDWLFDHFREFSSTRAEGGQTEQADRAMAPYLIFSGRIRPSGELLLNPVWRKELPEGSSDEPGKGSYRIELRGKGGTPLFERLFEPQTLYDLENHLTFYEEVPAQPGATTAIVDGPGLPGPIVINAGTGVPFVRVLTPNGGEKWPPIGEREIRWSGKDPDGDAVLYTVFFSNDMGTTWQVVDESVAGQRTVVNLADLPGGTKTCLVKVIASDGINQGEDQSDTPFTKAGQPPLVKILSPDRAATFMYRELAVFEALVTDREDGRIPDGALQWTSDRDGVFGRGLIASTSTLSPGLHMVQFRAIDSDRMAASDTVPVYVRAPEVWPDSKVNGMDGTVRVAAQDPLQGTISLNAGNAAGAPADWWVILLTPTGYQYLDVARGWMPGIGLTYQGPLFSFPPFPLINNPNGTPAGPYGLFFGVDTIPNGVPDIRALEYDLVMAYVRDEDGGRLPDATVTGIDCADGILSVDVANIGEAAIGGNAPGGLYIWIDNVLEWTYSWSTWTCQDFRAAGGTCRIQPQILSGAHTVRACMDPNGELLEADETNNCLEVDLNCSKPDLTPDISLAGADQATAGQALKERLRVTVSNIGSADAGPFRVGLYLSPDPVIDTSDTLLVGGREAVQALPAGDTVEVTLNGSMTIPATTPAGSYYLGVLADEYNEVDELDETNNDHAVPIKVQAGTPDVAVTGITWANNSLIVTVENLGTGAVPPDVHGGLYIWIDGILEWTYSWATWACQDFRAIGGACGINPQNLTGSHTVRACMDPNDILYEPDEINNCMEVTM